MLAYAIAWISFSPVILSRTGLGLFGFAVPIEFVVIGSFGPFLAALLTHWLSERNLRAFKLYASWKSLLVGAIIGPALIAITFVIIPGLVMTKSSPGTLHWRIFGSLAVVNWSTFMGGPLGEELGWRGFALPRLQTSLGPVAASLVLGCLWAGWHLPLFLMKGWTSSPIGLFALIEIGLTVLMTFGFNLSEGSVLVAVLMHATFNTISRWLNGLLASVAVRGSPSMEMVLALSSLSAAALVVVFTRGRLGAKADRRVQ